MFNKRLDNKGMTLVDTIVGFALLAICATMLAIGFSTCARLINEANTFKVESARVSTEVEVESYNHENDTNKHEGSVVVDKNRNISVDGVFYKSKDPKTGLNYTLFVPKSIEK